MQEWFKAVTKHLLLNDYGESWINTLGEQYYSERLKENFSVYVEIVWLRQIGRIP